jgi:hypothetical protein
VRSEPSQFSGDFKLLQSTATSRAVTEKTVPSPFAGETAKYW